MRRLMKLLRSGLKTRLLNPVDEFWDLRFGVRTLGYVPEVGIPGAPRWQGAYVATTYTGIIAALRSVGVGPQDVFVDLGCGLGRAVFAASWLGAKKSIGVEINADLVAQAQASARRSRLPGQIEFQCVSADEFDPSEMTVLFLFNPFGSAVMKAVVDRIDADLAKNPRNFRLVYENSVQSPLMDAAPNLRRTDHWPANAHGNKFATTFWESKAKGRN